MPNYKVSKYEQFVKVKDNELEFYTCTCPDFTFRQIHLEPIGKCKHLLKIESWIMIETPDRNTMLEYLKKRGFDYGTSLTGYVRKKYLELLDTCEFCNKPFTGEFHNSDKCIKEVII